VKLHERSRDDRVRVLAPLYVAGLSLREELHGHAQHLPHERGRPDDGHFAVYLERVDGLHGRHDHLHHGDCGEQGDEGHEQIGVLAREQVVHEEARERGGEHLEQVGDERGEGDERYGGARSLQAVAGEFDRALALAAGHEVVGGGEGQAYAAVGALELLYRDRARAFCRVVHADAIALEAAQHGVVRAVGDDAGVRALASQCIDAALVAVDVEPVAARRFGDVLEARAISRNAAIDAHLLERHPFPVVGHDHGERGSAALERFHLHDLGNLGHAFGYGNVRLRHSQPR
jgi:hypothetical protein